MDSIIRIYLKQNFDEFLIYEKCLDFKRHRNIYYIIKCEKNSSNINVLRLTNGVISSYSIASGYFPSYQYLKENNFTIESDSVARLYQYWSHDPYFHFEYYSKNNVLIKDYRYRNLIPETYLSIFVNMIERDLLSVLESSYYMEYFKRQKDINNVLCHFEILCK